jgi:hypothetical protein
MSISTYTLQDAVPMPTITVHICDRSPQSFDTVRKFLAECGTKLEVHLTRHGKIRTIRPVDLCRYGKDCPMCKKRKEMIEQLIKDGK